MRRLLLKHLRRLLLLLSKPVRIGVCIRIGVHVGVYRVIDIGIDIGIGIGIGIGIEETVARIRIHRVGCLLVVVVVALVGVLVGRVLQ